MKNEQIVLRYFLEQARGGRSACDVFDACYETNLHCAELLPVLETLLAKKELEREDIRTYRFVGSLDPRGWEGEKEAAPEAPPRKRLEDFFPSKEEKKDDYARTMQEWREMHEQRRKIFEKAKARELREKREACLAELRKERDRLKAQTENGKSDDTLYLFRLRRNAMRVVLESNSAGIAFLQRKLQIGYNRAGEILQWMEENGLVSGFDGMLKTRTVLFSREEFEENCAFEESKAEESKTEEKKDAKSDSDCTLLTIRALKWAIARGRINATLLCNRFSVGEEEANQMMKWMFERGFITSPEEPLSTTLLTRAEFENLFPFGGGEDGEGGAD